LPALLTFGLKTKRRPLLSSINLRWFNLTFSFSSTLKRAISRRAPALPYDGAIDKSFKVKCSYKNKPARLLAITPATVKRRGNGLRRPGSGRRLEIFSRQGLE
jgi:hypothetical protein